MKYFVMLMLALAFTFNSGIAQVTKGENPFDTETKLQDNLSKSLGDQLTSSELIPTGNVVVPNHYYIGPGDVFSLTITPILPYPIVATISPSTILTIPRFGDISLNGLTITQAQDSIQKFLQTRNKDLKCVLSLVKPRMCLVTVKGNVIFPNIYSIPASYQISTAINYANKVNPDKIPGNEVNAITKYNEQVREREKLFISSRIAPNANYYSRNVLVLNNNGNASNVDIEKSKVLNNPEFNPYVKEGDEIIVPFEFNDFPTISISGEINRPITLPYHSGDKASLLLKFGYGFTPNADLNNIKLYIIADNQQKEIPLNIDNNGNLIGQDYDLTPGSVIIVGSKALPQNTQISTVAVYGEVHKPGIYVITEDKTRIKDVISEAGGFTQNAHLPLAKIYRFDKNAQFTMDIKRDFNESFQYSNLTLEDTTRFLIDMEYPKNYVSCDFDKLYNENNENFNVTLKNGDIVFIPKHPNQVYVYGQVKNPGYVEYVPNKTLEYYVQKAGGYSDGAEINRSRIIRGRNLIWDKPDDNVFVNAGDQVYIPRYQDIPVWLEIQKYGTYAAIVGTIGSIINLLYSIYLTQTRK
jgi:protein involved in polysaccharide export with SLBB domain